MKSGVAIGLERLSVPVLTVMLVGLFVVRAVVFSNGGTVGLIVIVLFWVVFAVLCIRLVFGLAAQHAGWDYAFLLIALLAIGASAILGKGVVGPSTFIVFILSIVGLLTVWLSRKKSGLSQ